MSLLSTAFSSAGYLRLCSRFQFIFRNYPSSSCFD